MALILLQVLVLGVTAAAVDDVGVTWSAEAAPCAVADWARLQSRRPPPPLDDERRAKPYWRSSQNGTLEVSSSGDGGELRPCAVRHHGGIVLGYPVALKYTLTDRQLKSRDKKASGQPLVVPCSLAAEHLGDRSLDNNKFFSVQSEQFNLEIKGEDAVQYRCKATKQKSRSPWAGYGRQEYAPEEDSYYDEEEARALTCPLHGWPRVNLTWELSPPGGRGDEALVLPNLEHDKEGVYACTVVGQEKNATGEPLRMLHAPVSKQARRASTVRFNCTVEGARRLLWYKDGRPLAISGRINVRNSADGQQRPELVIGGLTVNDTGVYQCFAYGRFGFVSGWAQLHVNVTGGAAAPPAHLRCAPLGPHSVEVRWRNGTGDLAYTVHIKPKGVANNSEVTALPINTTFTISELEKALTPYQFQVVAYLKYGASDPSHSVVCQGQGVPIKLSKSGEDQVVISWRSFAEQTPGVAEWILQYRPQDSRDPEKNVTLAGEIHNYTITVPPRSPLLVRVLGSRTLEWLPQNLTLVPWTSTARAGDAADDGILEATVEDVVVTLVKARSATLRWRCVRCPPKHSFHVCARAAHHDAETDVCRDSVKPNATIDGLSPGTEYELRVQVRAAGRTSGTFSAPYQIFTLRDGPQRFKDLTYKFVNESALLVTWTGAPAVYTVHHSAQLRLPVDRWAAKQVDGNSVLITDIQPSQHTYVMVTGYDPLVYSPILTVPPPRDKDSPESKDYKYEFTSAGVVVRWAGGGSRLVRYSQNITRPLEHWATANASGGAVELEGLEPALPLYVLVSGAGTAGQVLTIPPRPENNHFYLSLGLGFTVGVLCVLAVTAAFFWRRRKRAQQLTRSRRGHAATASPEEEGSEMKTVGARLCNGAGEPLLNGHVHITENPASKTPNGRVKRGRWLENQFEAFDLSRTDADTTQETTLDDSCEPTKLPDDNMNVQPGFPGTQPTLQPNG